MATDRTDLVSAAMDALEGGATAVNLEEEILKLRADVDMLLAQRPQSLAGPLSNRTVAALASSGLKSEDQLRVLLSAGDRRRELLALPGIGAKAADEILSMLYPEEEEVLE